MADISIKDVQKVAALSGLTFNDEELEKYREQFAEILGYIDRLSTVDLADAEPTYQVTGLKNVMRDDEIIDYGVDQAALLQNAPEVSDSQIKVKRVL